MSKELKVMNEEDTQSQHSDNIVRMIEQVAMNPDVPVDKMERIMAMQERILDRQAQQDFTAAMVRVQKSIPAIVKHRKNEQTNSAYADLDDINRVIKPIYSAEGFSLSFGTDGEHLPGTVRIVCEVSHIGGYSKTFTYDAPIDDKGIKGTVNKTATHARGSANTYGQRYLVKMIFNLTLAGEDDDGNAAGGIIEGAIAAYEAIQNASSLEELKSSWQNECERNPEYTALINQRKKEIASE